MAGIISTSLEKIIQVSPDFKELLLLICLLDSQNIPKSFLESYKEASVVEQFLYSLRKHALITHEFSIGQKKSSHTFSLHRSTQSIGLIFFKSLLPDNEKGIFFDKLSTCINKLNIFEKKDCDYKKLLLPHFEALIKKLPDMGISNALRDRCTGDLLLPIGDIYRRCLGHLLLSKQYLSRLFSTDAYYKHMKPSTLALLLKTLGGVCVDLGELEEGITYCRKSITFCDNTHEFRIVKAENMKVIGVAYSEKNDFEKAKNCYEKALNTLPEDDNSLRKREAEAEIYIQLASLYSKTYINRKEAYQAEKYIL